MKALNAVSLGVLLGGSILNVPAQAQSDNYPIPVPGATPAKTFKPLPMQHPLTGKSMKPMDVISLPDGRKMRAKDYFEELNQLERELNQHGQSLKSLPPVVDIAALNRPELDRQKAEIEEKLKQEQAGTQNNGSGPSPRGTVLNYSINRSWGDGIGDNTFGANWNGNFTLNASADASTKVSAIHSTLDQYFGVRVFNNYKEVLHGRVDLNTGISGGALSIDGSTRVFVMGNQWWGYSKSITLNNPSYQFSPVFAFPPFQASYSFWLGPIPMTVTAGIVGTVGVQGNIGVRWPMYLDAQITPSVDSSAYGSLAVNLGIAGGGIQVNVKPLQGNLQLVAGGGLNYIGGKKNFYTLGASATLDADLRALSGNLSVFGWLWPFPQMQADLFNWGGLTYKGRLFSESYSTILP